MFTPCLPRKREALSDREVLEHAHQLVLCGIELMGFGGRWFRVPALGTYAFESIAFGLLLVGIWGSGAPGPGFRGLLGSGFGGRPGLAILLVAARRR